MKIALVAPLVSVIAEPFLGGAQALVADLARGLTRRGHSVTLFAREGSFVPGVQIEPIAVPESVLPAVFSDLQHETHADSGFFAQANLFLELFLRLRQRGDAFDVIHVHAYDWPAFTCSALVHNIPIIHTIHVQAISPAINAALRVLHEQGHPLTLVTVSHACAATYADYTPIDHIIYNGIDMDAIPFSSQVAPDAPLLFAGRLAPEKGADAAIAIALRAGHRLLIAGSLYDHDYYDQRIVPLLRDAGDRVTYVGHLSRQALWQLMGQALGLLFPSAWDEPFGLAAAEAMAAGTPVIAYRRGAVAEIIRDGETGFIVEPDDIDRAAALVASLPALSRALCRARIATTFSSERMIDAYEGVYKLCPSLKR